MRGSGNDLVIEITGNGDRGRLPRGMELNCRPGRRIGGPGPGCRLLRSQFRWLVAFGNALRVDCAHMHPLPIGSKLESRRLVCEGYIDTPGRCHRISPDECGRGDAGRKDGAVLRVVNGDACACRLFFLPGLCILLALDRCGRASVERHKPDGSE